MWHESEVSEGKVLVYAAAAITGALLTLGLSAALAFGQSSGSDNVQYSAVCQNIIGAIGVIQNQSGNAEAIAVGGAGGDTTGGGGDAEAVAEVAQAQGVSIAQVNECLNAADEGPGGDTTTGEGTTGGSTTGGDDGTASADVIKGTIPDQKVLAATGGPAVLLPALGLLLVASGAAAIRALLRR
jgi:hypothetical protein